MKKNRTKITACILALVMILASVSMTSCASYYSELLEYYRELGEANNNNNGGATNLPSDSKNEAPDTQNPDKPQGSADTNIKIEMDESFSGSDVITPEIASGDIVRATAQGLRSAVSVYCSFEVTSSSETSFWNPKPSTETYYSAGSGIVYKTEDDGSGYIVTNFHGVYQAESNTPDKISDNIFVYLYGMVNEMYAIPATFVGGSPNYDIAVLRIDKNAIFKNAIERGSVAAVSIADSNLLVPGETAIVVGNPSAEGISATKGIVNIESEYITMTAIDDESATAQFRVIRIDAPVNIGNSGGGVYNDRGELIGIINAKEVKTNIENIGYAIPSSIVRGATDNIIDNCCNTDCKSVMRGMLGITVVTNGLSTVYDAESGLIIRVEQIAVYEVTDGGIGASILKEGDVIRRISAGDKTVTVSRQYHLIDFMLDVRVGDTLNIDIVRDGLEMTVSAKLTEDCFVAY